MIKTIKDIRIFGVILSVILVMFIAAGYLDGENFDDENYLVVGAFFLNPSTNMLESETHTISRGPNDEMISELLDILLRGPRSSSLVNTIPENIVFLKGELFENRYRLQLEFSNHGDEMTTEEELFFKGALCWTMTELSPIVTDVHIYINDREMLRADASPVGFLNRQNIDIEKQISPFRQEIHRAVLYFADSNYTGLIPEERVIMVSMTSPNEDMARHVVERLIAGPSRPDHFATIPPETSIREVSTEGDICYVNLSADVFSRAMDPDGDMLLTIYSLVNSLTELDDIRRVQFLIDSRIPVDPVGAGHNLSVPIERDETLILTTE